MTTTPTPGAAGTSTTPDRQRLLLALVALARATEIHLDALEALNTARDHIESVLMRTAGVAEVKA